jgi:hypothetical protein
MAAYVKVPRGPSVSLRGTSTASLFVEMQTKVLRVISLLISSPLCHRLGPRHVPFEIKFVGHFSVAISMVSIPHIVALRLRQQRP